MKRICKYLFIMLIGFVPFSMAFGQEKKSEQKIKIVTNDGSGNITVLDTTITDGTMPGTIKLKNGKVIYLAEPDTRTAHITPEEGTESIFVSVSSDGDGVKKEEKKVIIMSGDSIEWTAMSPDKGKHVSVYSNADASKYIIAKDGMVITVEGNDEAKAKEIIKLIEDKLNIKSESGEKKEVVKNETIKRVKK